MIDARFNIKGQPVTPEDFASQFGLKPQQKKEEKRHGLRGRKRKMAENDGRMKPRDRRTA
jgi:hypothetical protein